MSELHEAVAAHLQRRLVESATGRSEDLIVDNRPRNVLFAGCLISRPDAKTDDLESAEDFYARLAPSAMQLNFLVPVTRELKVSLQPRCHVYYRVMPPFSAQQRRSGTREEGDTTPDKLVRAFRKTAPAFSPSPVVLETNAGIKRIPFGSVVSDAVAAAVAADPDALRPRDNWMVPATALRDAEALRTWCGAESKQPKPPVFEVDVEVQLKDWSAQCSQVIVTLVNRSSENSTFEKDDYWELTLFDASITATLDDGSRILPYSFAALPNSYRFDRDQWGTGVNCVAMVDSSRSKATTEAIATHLQPRLEHRRIEGLDLSFKKLIDDPLPALRGVADAMAEYRSTRWATEKAKLDRYPADHLFRVEFDRDLAEFDRDAKEFQAGIDLLRDPRFDSLRQAFCLTNEAFAEVGRAHEWRLFQLVFVVRNLAALAAREWPSVAATDDVEILWFPTGGGKTEAFLGLLTTALFFDRLRGRAAGVTGVIRLPLRLLSHQQFQRVVRTVAAAEQVRRRRNLAGRAFSVGYWIGQGGSPNIVDKATAKEWESNPASCQKWRKISRCPFCGSNVSLRFNRALWSLAHHCESGQCGNKGDLPLYVVDDELYRFLPSVVVGTVDKLAAFGFQRRFGNLIGWPIGLCPKHGYSPLQTCLVPDCKEEAKEVSLKDPVPSMLVQDELHLLKEDLGAFDGHYETAVLGAQAEVPGGRPWKVIAATATIEAFDWQVEHLYCKRARRFPSPGPTWQDTFYSHTTSATNRLFVGILPFNRSHINSMISALWIYHREIRALRKKLTEQRGTVRELLGGAWSDDDIAQALRDYEVSLTYVLTRKAGDQMAESLATQVAGYMRDEGEEHVQIRSLTGQTSTIEVEQILDEIELGGRRQDVSNAPVDAVVATSMISHGVDVDRFNFIAFFGMPRLTAEYIQASSRVGRRFPGLALVMFSPARERDRSHFHLFGKYHQYLERLVEPPAINRWAKFAIKHTLPGILIGSIINVASRQLRRKLHLERDLYAALHNQQVLTIDTLVERVVRYYAPDRDRVGELTAYVKHDVELFVNGLRRNAARNIWEAHDFRPMLSLRDVEEPVPFLASRYSADAFALWMRRRRSTVPSGETAIE